MKTIKKIISEKTSYKILVTWCILPVVMSFYSFATTLTGRFPVTANGVMDMNCLIAQAMTYHFAFRVLGIITLFFAVYAVIMSRNRIISGEQVRQNPWMYLLLSILAWSVFSALRSDNFSRAFSGMRYCYTGLESYYIFSGIFICAAMIRRERYRKIILRLFCAVIVYLSVLVIIQAHTNTFLDYSLTPNAAAVFLNSNHFGYVLCMAIIGCAALYLLDTDAKRWLRFVYAVWEGILIYTVFLNNTFGAFLSVLLALPVLYTFYFKSGGRNSLVIWVPAVLFIALTVVNTLGLMQTKMSVFSEFFNLSTDLNNIAFGAEEAAQAGTGRGILWMDTMNRITQRPVFGFGPDGFYGVNAITDNQTPHNEFLQMAAYTGIPSLLLYLSALVILAVHHWKKLKELDPMVIAASAVTVTYLISSFFGNPIFNTAPYFWIFLGLATATNESVQPIITIETKENTKAQTKKQLRYGGYVMTALVCVLAVFVLFAYSIWKSDEYIREYADLQGMRNAELTVISNDYRGTLNGNGEYWYDASTFKLIPVYEPIPAPYGRGTKVYGEALENFNKSFATEYDYDEKADYTDKIIRVHVKGSGNDLDISLEWVSVK